MSRRKTPLCCVGHNCRFGLPVVASCLVFCWISGDLRGGAAEPVGSLGLLGPADATTGSSYGEIVVDKATEASLRAILGSPVVDKDRVCVWIGSDGCRQLGLKMVRASFAEDGVLSHATVDLREPISRAEALKALALGDPVKVRSGKALKFELFVPANLALGVQGDRVIRLCLFGRRTFEMTTKASPALPPAAEQPPSEEMPATPEDLNALLHRAVQLGDATRVGQLVAAGASVLATDTQGWTALHHAAFSGQAAVIPALVIGSVQHAAPNAEPNDSGLSPFSAVLDQRAQDGATAFHLACVGQHVDAAQVLLRLGANPNVGDGEGRRPLHWAALNSELDLAQALLLARADVYSRTRRGYIPLDLATDDPVRQLLTQAAARAGADPEEAQVRATIAAFLQAAHDGDAAKMKSWVVPELQEKLSDRAEMDRIQWTIESVELASGAAVVRCPLTSPDGPAELRRALVVFRLSYLEQGWRISEIEL